MFPYDKGDGSIIKPQTVIETLYEVTHGDAFITSDVGQHQMFASQYYKFNKPNRWINSGGLGTMGFGFPAAMGIKLNFPDDDVACVTGEGSIQMNIQELSTCLQYDLPVKIVNLNNGALGMVRQWQDMQYNSRYSHSYMESLPDFVKLAEAYGHVGMRITDLKDLKPKMEEAFAMKNRLVFLDIQVDASEHVYPMQIRDGAMRDMWLSKTERTLIMRHIISLLLENEPGALSRVVGLFSQRNYNIESLTVAPTEDPTLSRLTLTTVGHDEVIEQITKNLNKLIEVVKLVDLSESAHIEARLMLVKVKATGAQRAEVKRTTDIFRGQIVDVTSSVYTVQLAGTSDKLDSFIQAIGTASILEVVRSGVTGIARGDKTLSI